MSSELDSQTQVTPMSMSSELDLMIRILGCRVLDVGKKKCVCRVNLTCSTANVQMSTKYIFTFLDELNHLEVI